MYYNEVNVCNVYLVELHLSISPNISRKDSQLSANPSGLNLKNKNIFKMTTGGIYRGPVSLESRAQFKTINIHTV